MLSLKAMLFNRRQRSDPPSRGSVSKFPPPRPMQLRFIWDKDGLPGWRTRGRSARPAPLEQTHAAWSASKARPCAARLPATRTGNPRHHRIETQSRASHCRAVGQASARIVVTRIASRQRPAKQRLRPARSSACGERQRKNRATHSLPLLRNGQFGGCSLQKAPAIPRAVSCRA